MNTEAPKGALRRLGQRLFPPPVKQELPPISDERREEILARLRQGRPPDEEDLNIILAPVIFFIQGLLGFLRFDDPKYMPKNVPSQRAPEPPPRPPEKYDTSVDFGKLFGEIMEEVFKPHW